MHDRKRMLADTSYVPLAPAFGSTRHALSKGFRPMDAGYDDHVRSMVRPYVVTGGRTRATVALALETLVETTQRGRAMCSAVHLHPEQRLTLELCDQGLHSVAEISAHVRLPFGVARVVVADMALQQVVTIHTPFADTGPQAIHVLERVISGLRKL
jgi:Protein of unknown function (DUF742)